MGFIVDELRPGYVFARFVHRHEWDIEVEDPARGKIAVHQIEVKQFRFGLYTQGPELEVENPPRSLAGFTELLTEQLGQDLVFEEISVTPASWLAAIEALAGKVRVTAVTMGGVTLSAQASALVHIEGTEDVRKYQAKLVPNRQGQVERVVCAMADGSRCELSVSGRAVVNGGSAKTMDLLRLSLREAMKKNKG